MEPPGEAESPVCVHNDSAECARLQTRESALAGEFYTGRTAIWQGTRPEAVQGIRVLHPEQLGAPAILAQVEFWRGTGSKSCEKAEG